ncbi:MAG: NUDIX hydrolase [Oscillospiraceae bacterium]|nr:NUDIX hydrolase [Oscillospiraceae bacterium]MDY3257377.1 NUDIX hydrolase [Ruminococcus callidus]
MNKNEKWLEWAVELQALAQSGLYYGKDKFDIERYQRIREISAEMLSYKTEIPYEKVYDIFCTDTGYQTPKIDTRAAIFKDNKILLVHEANDTWSLPGGWVDVNLSVEENTIKEVKEEAGIDAVVKKIIAVQDREKHNRPIYAYKVCKIFSLCEATGGSFTENIETTGYDYFKLENLPKLAEEKNNEEQIKMCFECYKSEYWETLFD